MWWAALMFVAGCGGETDTPSPGESIANVCSEAVQLPCWEFGTQSECQAAFHEARNEAASEGCTGQFDAMMRCVASFPLFCTAEQRPDVAPECGAFGRRSRAVRRRRPRPSSGRASRQRWRGRRRGCAGHRGCGRHRRGSALRARIRTGTERRRQLFARVPDPQRGLRGTDPVRPAELYLHRRPPNRTRVPGRRLFVRADRGVGRAVRLSVSSSNDHGASPALRWRRRSLG